MGIAFFFAASTRPKGQTMRDRPRDAARPSLPAAARFAASVAAAVTMLVGILALGRLANSDVVAIVLTTVFFLIVLGILAFIVQRRRELQIPLAIPFVFVALVAGVALGRPLVTDKVVNEQVTVADGLPAAASTPPASSATSAPGRSTPPTKSTPLARRNVTVASGTFQAIAHPGRGSAMLIRTANSGVRLTFTNFETDNGPDVRVYLSRGTQQSGKGTSFIELGALKGNKGNQEYVVPANLDLTSFDAVVLWCRAFAVGFVQAPLKAV